MGVVPQHVLAEVSQHAPQADLVAWVFREIDRRVQMPKAVRDRALDPSCITQAGDDLATPFACQRVARGGQQLVRARAGPAARGP